MEHAADSSQSPPSVMWNRSLLDGSHHPLDQFHHMLDPSRYLWDLTKHPYDPTKYSRSNHADLSQTPLAFSTNPLGHPSPSAYSTPSSSSTSPSWTVIASQCHVGASHGPLIGDVIGIPLHKFFSFYQIISVTRLGDLLDFGQLFKAFGNN